MMKSKFTVVVCALAIALAAVIGIFITLIATGVVDSTPKKIGNIVRDCGKSVRRQGDYIRRLEA